MWSPPQRGGAFELTIPGQSICYLKKGPCGNIPPEEPRVTLIGGQQFNILFQQNLNHFYVRTLKFANLSDTLPPDPQPWTSSSRFCWGVLIMRDLSPSLFWPRLKIQPRRIFIPSVRLVIGTPWIWLRNRISPYLSPFQTLIARIACSGWDISLKIRQRIMVAVRIFTNALISL